MDSIDSCLSFNNIDVKFSSKKEKISFSKQVEILHKNNIEMIFTNDIKNILVVINLDDKNIGVLQKINWKILGDKIYRSDFLEFLKLELGISKDKKLVKLFTKQNKFDVENDLISKCDRYDIGVVFDYKREGKKNTAGDFSLYFNRRLQYFMDFFDDVIDTSNLSRISTINSDFSKGDKVSFIGLVSDMWSSKKGTTFTIEDKSGSIKCYANNNKTELNKLIDKICLDEVIAIEGDVGDNIVWISNIVFPKFDDYKKEIKKCRNENYIACVSDFHVGQDEFDDDSFEKFVNFLSCKGSNLKLNDIAKKIKYILIAGDVIDGIGIYPDQGKNSRYFNTGMHYRKVAMLLDKIPKDKAIIIIPGNHDTTRMSEPQLKIKYDIGYSLYNMKNVIMLSNPSKIKLFNSSVENSLDALMYHGSSFFYYAQKNNYLIKKGGIDNWSEVMKFLLKKRHLAPSFGSTLCFPDELNDPLIIDTIPDLFITGHLHKQVFSNYENCSMISCSGWSKQSDYQKAQNIVPDIGKCFIINTKTRKPTVLNFHKEK